MLPFAEDIREFPFPSFSRFPASWKPDEQQQAVADNLVKMLDLAPSPKEEVLKPDLTPNPVLLVKTIYFSFLLLTILLYFERVLMKGYILSALL